MGEPIRDGERHFSAAVVGGGPAGLAAAIALGMASVDTALIARRVPYADNRTTALLGGSVDLLQRMGVWERCAASATPLRVMRLVDDTKRLLRAPEVQFRCDEIGIDAFGYNIENRHLLAAMEARLSELPAIARFDDDAEAIDLDDRQASLRGKQGHRIASNLVVAADGRQSMCRKAAGIPVVQNVLKQSALTFNVAHARAHQNTSTEFHTSHGPCVFVPLPRDRSSVVWVTTPDEAARLAALSDDELSAAIERQSHFHLGSMRVEAERHVFPLAFERPLRLAARRVALIGEAAHVLPPIGAQGLNLGLRDAAAIAAIAASTLAAGHDVGGETALASYERQRRSDVMTRSTIIDIANRTLLSDFLPLQAMRAIGMQLLDNVGPLRRKVMREALASASGDRDHGQPDNLIAE